ncbi:hypothetical protein AB4Z21_00940 [Paenibacillus sp. MCAF20]
MIGAAINKVKEIGYNRCGNCPAFWHNVGYWGEADAGCSLHRDTEEFCLLSLLPQFVAKPYVKLQERCEEKRWDKIYEQEMKKWEHEEASEQS